MLFRGLVIKVEKHHIVVLTDEQDYVRIRLKGHAAIGQKIYFTEEDLCDATDNTSSWRLMDHRKILSVASLIFAFIIVIGFWHSNLQRGISDQAEVPYVNDMRVATIVTVDINPSIKLALDSNHRVISVEALNADALTLALDGMVGLAVEDALEEIVFAASAEGFINPDDQIDDYILITTIPMTFSPQSSDTLKSRLEEKIADNAVFSDIQVALIQGTKKSLKAAEDKKVPLGLYMIDPNIAAGNKEATVKEFFKQTDNLKAFKDKGEIITQKGQGQRKQIEAYIDKLKAKGIPTADYEATLKLPDADLESLLSQLKSHWSIVEKQKTDPTQENAQQDESEKDKDNKGPKNPDNGNQKSPGGKH